MEQWRVWLRHDSNLNFWERMAERTFPTQTEACFYIDAYRRSFGMNKVDGVCLPEGERPVPKTKKGKSK